MEKRKRAGKEEGEEGKERGREKGCELREEGDHDIEVRLTKLLKYSGRLPVRRFPPKPLGRDEMMMQVMEKWDRGGRGWIVHSPHLGQRRKSIWYCSRKIEISKET